MFLILRYIAKLLKALSSEASPGQIAGGLVLGMIIGLTPFFSAHNLLILLIIILFRVNIGMALLGFIVFSGVAWLADPLFHDLGTSLLESESLRTTWESMYEKEWIAMTRFYNTVVLGSFVTALGLVIPAFPLAIVFVKQYRKHIHERVQKWKIVKALKGTKLYSVYETYSRVRG